MPLTFDPAPRPEGVSEENWLSWQWQFKNSLKTAEDFQRWFQCSDEENMALVQAGLLFKAQTTPYYASLASRTEPRDPIRKILMPHSAELNVQPVQHMRDPLGENRNTPAPRIVHRYPDRVLFLVTDICSVYCRYCTRKHFTGQDQAFVKKSEYDQALAYIRKSSGVKEVILSGGDPLTLSNSILDRVLDDLRSIEHVEIIRIGSRIPVVNPMRIDDGLVAIFKRHKPVYLMVHFNHPRELTWEASQALELVADSGTPILNQMVLLNGVNNHPAIVKSLSRRLLYLRVKPYYMFQCDPSEGSDHLRTSIKNSKWIQSELWGKLSGLAMPNLSLDIPDGGGKVGIVPDFVIAEEEETVTFKGWDGKVASYKNPSDDLILTPYGWEEYL